MIAVDVTDNLDGLLARLESLKDVPGIVAPDLENTIGNVRRLAVTRAHKRTGDLRRALHVEGPTRLNRGTLEARVTPLPDVTYGIFEVKRGGEHDYTQKTIDAAQALITDLERQLERRVAERVGA